MEAEVGRRILCPNFAVNVSGLPPVALNLFERLTERDPQKRLVTLEVRGPSWLWPSALFFSSFSSDSSPSFSSSSPSSSSSCGCKLPHHGTRGLTPAPACHAQVQQPVASSCSKAMAMAAASCEHVTAVCRLLLVVRYCWYVLFIQEVPTAFSTLGSQVDSHRPVASTCSFATRPGLFQARAG
jgi:hypothetical protein